MASVHLPPDAAVSAPQSGVRLGVGEAGPMLLRLFRLAGTSVALVSTVAPAQLAAIRVAAGGTPVQIVTARPSLWQGLSFNDRLGQIYSPADDVRPPDGPSLLLDDRPAQARRPIDSAPWQCRVDVRTQWTRRDLSGFAYADLTIFGTLPPEATDAVASSYRVPLQVAAGLARMEPGTVGVARRGLLEFVRLDPTPAEAMLMAPVQDPPNQPVWR